jgi:hypothetical protein
VRPNANLEAFGLRPLAEGRAPLRSDLGRPRNLLALGRDAGVEIKRPPLDIDVEFLLELVDPSLADITPRSNEVAVHPHRGRHGSLP